MNNVFAKTIQIPPPEGRKRSLGFTLAEVLLALTIVGVVSSLTVSALMNSVAQSQYNSGVWQAENMLSQAVEQLQANNGIVHAGTNIGFTLAGDNVFRNDFCNVLQCVRMDIASNLYSGNPLSYKSASAAGDGFLLNSTGIAGAILSNDIYLSFASDASCTGWGMNECGIIGVDINGPNQGPNMFGEDVYLFAVVLNNGIYSILPDGAPNDGLASSGRGAACAIGQEGLGCTYQRLYNPNGMP